MTTETTTTTAGVQGTHGQVNATPSVALDIVLGERDYPVDCAQCGRHLPALDRPAFEAETPDGDVVCVICLDKQNRGIRLAVLLLDHALKARQTGDHQAALETIAAVVNGLELLDEQTPRPAYRRPVRQQPNRAARRRQRR